MVLPFCGHRCRGAQKVTGFCRKGSTIALKLCTEDVRAALDGDTAAFARLVVQCTPMVGAVSRAIVGDREAARDVAQEAFVQAWRDRQKLRDVEAFVPWLRQVARNQALLYLRRRYRRPADYATSNPEVTLGSTQAVATHSAQLLEAYEMHTAVREALDALPDISREPMVLFYREELSVAEVARQLGLSQGATKKRLERGRNALRQEVLARFAGETPTWSYDSEFGAGVLAALPQVQGVWWVGSGILAAIAGKVLPGIFMGTAGVLFGFWRHWRRVRDREERRELLGLTAWNLVAAVCFPFAVASGGKLQLMGALFVFLAAMAWSNLWWLPRVVSRRQALECLEDPRAFRRHQWERWLGWAGLVGGAVLGLLAIVCSMQPWV